MIDHRLRQLEPLAWKFACDFADSNRLQTTDTAACDEDATPSSAA
jgi:hypothetical protein